MEKTGFANSIRSVVSCLQNRWLCFVFVYAICVVTCQGVWMSLILQELTTDWELLILRSVLILIHIS